MPPRPEAFPRNLRRFQQGMRLLMLITGFTAMGAVATAIITRLPFFLDVFEIAGRICAVGIAGSGVSECVLQWVYKGRY